ncbi:MAG: transglutaminase family protein [Caulobacteraceae bacterium]|nr:transglutaminase family protein [Caulobacteraceae bacterium]
MARLRIRHETRYDYARPVSLGPQRLMLRPRDGHAIRILSAELTLSPGGETRWLYDALGNCVCLFAPAGETSALSIVSEIGIERFPAPLAPIAVADPQTALPVAYSQADRACLAPFMAPVAADEDHALSDWLRARLGAPDEPALDFLRRLNRTIYEEIGYAERFEEGTLDPGETLRRGRGACRDVAWLMTEALRRLGYAARFVSGYLHSAGPTAVRGAGATHAWTQVFLPDLGWLEFDPTNDLAESPDLIPVAATRTPEEAAPVSGEVRGDPAGSRMTVAVEVRAEGEPQDLVEKTG